MKTKTFNVYEGFYKSFAEVQALNEGFASDRWLVAQEEVLKKCRYGDWRELFPMDHYLMMLVREFIGEQGREPVILDIGGGLGATYWWLRKVMPSLVLPGYSVVENSAVVARAVELAEAGDLQEFHTDIPQRHFDLVYFGSSLQYFEDWGDIIQRSASSGAKYILFGKTPVSPKQSYVMIQNYYESRIPVVVTGFEELVSFLENAGFTLQLHSASASPVLGSYMEFPCGGVPDEYRFKYPVDMLFARKN